MTDQPSEAPAAGEGLLALRDRARKWLGYGDRCSLCGATRIEPLNTNGICTLLTCKDPNHDNRYELSLMKQFEEVRAAALDQLEAELRAAAETKFDVDFDGELTTVDLDTALAAIRKLRG